MTSDEFWATCWHGLSHSDYCDWVHMDYLRNRGEVDSHTLRLRHAVNVCRIPNKTQRAGYITFANRNLARTP